MVSSTEKDEKRHNREKKKVGLLKAERRKQISLKVSTYQIRKRASSPARLVAEYFSSLYMPKSPLPGPLPPPCTSDQDVAASIKWRSTAHCSPSVSAVVPGIQYSPISDSPFHVVDSQLSPLTVNTAEDHLDRIMSNLWINAVDLRFLDNAELPPTLQALRPIAPNEQLPPFETWYQTDQ